MAWYNASWKYRIKLTIDADYVHSSISDEAFLIDLSNMAADFFTNANSDGSDIRITTSDGTTELCREVVYMTGGSSIGEVWFKYTGALSNSVDTDIYIYYGNSGASDYAIDATYGAENVWSDNYFAVYHFQTDGTDSTDNDNDLTNSGGSFTAGTVAGGNGWINNSSTANYIYKTGSSTSLKNDGNSIVCFSWNWIHKDNKINQGINNLYTDYASGYEFQLTHSTTSYPDNNQMYGGYFREAGPNNRGFNNSPSINVEQWNYVVACYDAGVGEINFQANASTNLGYTTNQNTNGIDSNATMNFAINRRASDYYSGSAHSYYARFDSVRLKSEAIADGELDTHYDNESANGTWFVTWGSQESNAMKEIIGVAVANVKVLSSVGNIAQETYLSHLIDDANLQAYYRAESNGIDSSDNSYNLAHSTTPDYTTGKFGNAFDLTAADSDYLYIVDASCPNLEISGSQTWSAWIYLDSLVASGRYAIMAKRDTSNTGKWLRVGESEEIGFGLTGLTTNASVSTAASVVTTGTWYHVAGRYDSSATTLAVWINGNKTSVTASGSATDSDADFTVGAEKSAASDNPAQFFDGRIDEAMVFDRALSDAEVESLYKGWVKKFIGVPR